MEVVLNLVELLMDLGVMKQCLREEAISKQEKTSASPSTKPNNKDPQTPTSEKSQTNDPNNSHRQLMDIILKY